MNKNISSKKSPAETTEKQFILIVDDEEIACRLVSKRLMNTGYDVETAGSAQEMWSKLDKRCPDLILMDIVLPDMDGPEIVKALRGNARTRDIAIIFLSSIVDLGAGEMLPEVFVEGHSYAALGKPVDMDLLTQQISFSLASSQPKP